MEVLVMVLMDERSEWAKVLDELRVMLTTMFTFTTHSTYDSFKESFCCFARSSSNVSSEKRTRIFAFLYSLRIRSCFKSS